MNPPDLMGLAVGVAVGVASHVARSYCKRHPEMPLSSYYLGGSYVLTLICALLVLLSLAAVFDVAR